MYFIVFGCKSLGFKNPARVKEMTNMRYDHDDNDVMVIMAITMMMIIIITKPLAKVASRAGARPWLASRL